MDVTAWLRGLGRIAEARELLAPVYAAFAEGFAFPDLVEARALLDELGDPVAGAGATPVRASEAGAPAMRR